MRGIMTTLIPLTGYRRVSTAGQVTDGLGLPVQTKRVTGYAKPHGYRVIGWQEDPGISGEKDEAARPGIMACLKAIEAGDAAGIILTDLGRLSRKLTIQEGILAKVWSLGGIVVTVETGIVPKDDPEDPMRTAMRRMAGVFFQLDRAMVVKRLRNGRAEKASRGLYAGHGSPAFGVRAGEVERDGRKVRDLIVDETEQATLARMREMRDDGMSLREIAEQLNAAGIPSKRGGPWHPQTVSRALGR
jgi:DNA invertase Pin-like site-specific DNA recombinase